MESKEIFILEEAACYLGLGEDTLRDYIRKKTVIRVNGLFTKAALDAYDERRRAGFAARNRGRIGLFTETNPSCEINRERLRTHLDSTNLSLREIGKIFNRSHTAIWTGIKEMGYNYRARIERIHTERGYSRLPVDSPWWYNALCQECARRKISFKPCFAWHKRKEGSRYRTVIRRRAWLNVWLVHITFSNRPKKRLKDSSVHSIIIWPEDRVADFTITVQNVDGEVVFFVIPAASMTGKGAALPTRRKVHKPFGWPGLVPSVSRWWRYEGKAGFNLIRKHKPKS